MNADLRLNTTNENGNMPVLSWRNTGVYSCFALKLIKKQRLQLSQAYNQLSSYEVTNKKIIEILKGE